LTDQRKAIRKISAIKMLIKRSKKSALIRGASDWEWNKANVYSPKFYRNDANQDGI
jgi:hypothetical protein